MSNVQIPNLPASTSLNGTEQFEGVQAGTSVRITAQQIATFTATAYPAPGIASVTASAPISASTVGDAVSLSLDLQGVTNAYLATMAAGTVKANVTGGSASPSDVTPSAILDTFGTTKGSLLVRDTSSWAALTAGTNGQVLTSNGTTAVPSWQTISVSPGGLTPTGVTPGTYGTASTVPQFTVLASGQLSNATNVAIVIPATSVTGLGTMAVQNASSVAITGGTIDGVAIGTSSPTTANFTDITVSGTSNLGTVSSGTWHGTPVAVLYGGTGATTASGARTNLGAAKSGANSDITSLSGLTTPLSAPQGGTGFGSYTTGDLLYADTSSTLARLTDVATGNALISGGVGVAPSWGKIGLTTHVSGTLPVANGGSGATTLTGFLKGNGTSAFTAQATIDNADLTNSSLTIGSTSISLGGSTSTLAGLTTVTLTQDPTAALEAATKQYVDNEIATVSNLTYHTAAEYATIADLGTVTYSNGVGGVGATITQSGAPSVLIIDGYTFTASDVTNATRVLVKNQTSGLQNGVYVVTNEGSGAANWQLTRATDFDTVGTGPSKIETGASVFVTSGAANAATGWVMTTTGTIIVGTTALVWTQNASSSSVTVTSPLVKVGSVISLGTVTVPYGGTGLTSLTQYGLLYAPTTTTVGQVSVGTSGQPLISGGAGAAPAFGALSLSGSGVSGTLGVSNGGTGTNVAFTTGSVVFAGASGIYSQNSELFWDNTNGFLGVGTNTPSAELTVVSATQTYTPSSAGLPAGTDLYIVGANNANTRITQDAFGTGAYPAYTGRMARGTAASPTASQTGDILVEVTGRGYGATAFSSSSVARIDMEAAENFTDTAQGTYISFHTTALGSASPVERFRVGPSGQFGIGGATYGTSGYVLTSGGASAAPTWSQVSATSLSGVLPVANGGTNISSYTVGDLIYADGATSLAKLADVATGNALISGGVGVAPSWGKIGLTTHVSGTLGVGNGGTGVTSTPTDGQLLIGNGTGYSISTLTAGTAIGITNAAGSITINNAGVTSLTAGSGISVSASTGGVTISSTGVTGLTAGTNISLSGGTGSVTVNTVNDPTFSTSTTTPLVFGGTTASSSLTLQSTTGVGTTDSILFKVGNNGATTAMSINSAGTVLIGTLNLTNPLGTGYGGTGLTSFSANGAVYATSTSALTTGTLPVTGGGTGYASYTNGDILYANGTTSLAKLAAGTNGYVLTMVGGVPAWAASTGGVTSFQTSLSGLTPSTSTTGAVTLAGTLGATSGGTGQSTYATGDILYASASNTLSKLTAGTNGYVLTLAGGVPSWAAAAAGATGGGTDKVFWENDQTVTTSYTITAGKNAGTFGPISVNSGVTVTVPSGSTWSIV
jgi:hypothetical protein